jgi:hypothetical protein
VNDDSAIALRLLGVPRTAAPELATEMGDIRKQPLTTIRNQLRNMDEMSWKRALGEERGGIYRKVWRVLEGLE